MLCTPVTVALIWSIPRPSSKFDRKQLKSVELGPDVERCWTGVGQIRSGIGQIWIAFGRLWDDTDQLWCDFARSRPD